MTNIQPDTGHLAKSFNRKEWQIKLRAMSDNELQQIFRYHLNYVPNSPVIRPAMLELEMRGL